MKQDVLRELQLTQLEMLKYVQEFCKKNNIKYSLYCGTLLGAARHKGFIPWDDDLDICMSRAEYNRFIELWNKSEHENYYLQNKDNSKAFTQSFTKIRKKNTCFLQEYDLDKDYNPGIFIDIFPLDRIPQGTFKKKKYYFQVMLYHLYSHGYYSKDSSRIVKIVSAILLGIVPKSKYDNIRENLLNKITAYDNTSLPIVSIETISTIRTEYDADLLDEFTELEFEDGKYMCFSKWDHFLSVRYGNYMEFPPEEERAWKHKPVKISFTEDYQK